MVFVGAKVLSDGANMVQHQSGPPILACQEAKVSALLLRTRATIGRIVKRSLLSENPCHFLQRGCKHMRVASGPRAQQLHLSFDVTAQSRFLSG